MGSLHAPVVGLGRGSGSLVQLEIVLGAGVGLAVGEGLASKGAMAGIAEDAILWAIVPGLAPWPITIAGWFNLLLEQLVMFVLLILDVLLVSLIHSTYVPSVKYILDMD